MPHCPRRVSRLVSLLTVTLIAAGCAVVLAAQTPRIRLRLLSAQVVYTSPSDRTVHTKPAPVALGAAGFTFTDPTFGSPMVRVTDTNTNGGSPMRVLSNAGLSAWNTTSTKFLVQDSGGGIKVFTFNGTTAADSGLVVTSNLEPTFSFVDPDKIWGAFKGDTTHQIRTWTNSVSTLVLDLDVTYPSPSLAGTYIGSMQVSDGDVWICMFGGGGSDQHVYVHHSTAGLHSTAGRYFLHASAMDRSGRFVYLFPKSADIAVWGQVRIWDTLLNTETELTVLPAGHGVTGYGTYINQQGYTASTPSDNYQFQFRDLLAPTVLRELLTQSAPPEQYISDHTSWRNCISTVLRPMISSTFRYGDGLTDLVTWPWKAWDDEIVAIATDGSGRVWRFAHHQSVYDVNDFWTQPMVFVDPMGRYAVFHSNWGNTVGTGREDVFLVHLN